ncbi:MAG: extracellular solute-binding protein [bacterium]|nr:extracellular solute-binding protein [bacterium]
MKKKIICSIIGIIIIILLAIWLYAEKYSSSIYKKPISSLIVYTPNSLSIVDPLVSEFENDTGINVTVISHGTGELLKLIKERKYPQADILWGGSLTLLNAKKDLFEKYISKNEKYINKNYKNSSGYMTRFSVMPSVIIINTNLLGKIRIQGFQDLLNPKLKGKIANANPALSSSSFENLLTQLYAMGKGNPEKGWKYEQKLIKNLDGNLLNNSSKVYKGVSDGKYTAGLTFEEAAVNYFKEGAPISIIYPEEGTIMECDGVAIVKGTKNKKNAEKFVNFLTGKNAQELLDREFNRRSVRNDVGNDNSLRNVKNIKLLKDNEKWDVDNKHEILRKYKELTVKQHKEMQKKLSVDK